MFFCVHVWWRCWNSGLAKESEIMSIAMLNNARGVYRRGRRKHTAEGEASLPHRNGSWERVFERFDFGRCGLDLLAEWNRTPPSVCARYLNCTQIKNVAWAVGGENGDLTGLLYAFVFRTADVANLFIISPRKVLHSYPAISNDRVHSKMEQAVCTLKAHKCSVLKTLMSHLYNELNKWMTCPCGFVFGHARVLFSFRTGIRLWDLQRALREQ